MTEQRVALLTGASQGLGLSLARALAEQGWELVIDGRDPNRLAAAAGRLRAIGATVHAVAGDVADIGHRAALAKQVAAAGRLDAAVNNASELGPSPLPDLRNYDVDALARVFAVNVIAPLAITQLVLDDLEASGGCVVNITSDAAVEGYRGWGGYGSSKAALEQLSHVLSVEEAGVRVYWVDPGDLRTQMHQDAFPGEDISDRPFADIAVPGLLTLIEGELPSGRYRAQELAVTEPIR